MSLVSTSQKKQINSVIENDEGGWTLGHTAGDNDGGWTYAGMTCTVYMNYVYPHRTRTLEEMEAVIGQQQDKVEENVYEIYYGQYLLPIATVVGSDEVLDFELSCIINCGKGGFTEIYSKIDPSVTENVDSPAYKIAFCEAWKQHYHDIVLDNPSKQKFLQGWLNRVAHYE